MAAGRPAAFACRQGDPAAAPLNSRGRATMPPGPLASAVARQARSSSGGERSPHSQHRCKVSRSRGDSGKDRPRPGRVERHSGRERSLPEGLAEGAARETGLYLLGIERRAAGRSLLRRRAVHEAFRYGSGREWGIGVSAPFVAGFLSAPANAGALIAPKKHDLQGVASRAFLHVAAVHPSRCEGERYFLSGSDRAAFLPGHCQNSSFLRPEGSPLTRCLQAILIQSSDPAFCRAMNP